MGFILYGCVHAFNLPMTSVVFKHLTDILSLFALNKSLLNSLRVKLAFQWSCDSGSVHYDQLSQIYFKFGRCEVKSLSMIVTKWLIPATLFDLIGSIQIINFSDPDYFIQRMPLSANKFSIILQGNTDSSKYPFSCLNSRKGRSN